MGHSFLRRLRDDMIVNSGSRHGLDIGRASTINAAKMATKLGVSNHLRAIYTHCNYINLIKDLPRCAAITQKIEPSIVVIDIGSNDLANIKTRDHIKMLQLATQVTDFAASIPAKVVIIHAILPRTARITPSTETFQDNVDLYNNFLKNICETSDNLIYDKLRGFRNIWIDNVEYPLKVSDWSTDGIHCNSQSMKKYKARVRQAILRQVGRVSL